MSDDYQARWNPKTQTMHLGIGSALRTLEALGMTQVEFVKVDGPIQAPGVIVKATVRGEHFVLRADSLCESAVALLAAVAPHRLTVAHAANRAKVRLPEGGIGTLTYVDTSGVMAKVKAADGRHRLLPCSLLELVEE